jgi:hypothetical protein
MVTVFAIEEPVFGVALQILWIGIDGIGAGTGASVPVK